MPRIARALVLACAVILPIATLTTLTAPAAPATAATPVAARTSAVGATATSMCSVTARWHCYGETLRTVSSAVAARTTSDYWDAADIESQYGITDHKAPKPANPTVAVVEAFGYPDLASDLSAYRKQMGLPACTQASGCLKILNQNGKASPLPAISPDPVDDDWTGETALDVDMVSAGCPSCNILVVQATSDGAFVNGQGQVIDPNGMLEADRVAEKRTHWVSDSWGGPGDQASDTAQDKTYLSTPNTILTVATGDDGYTSAPDYPSTSPYAVAVGGVDGSPDGTFTAWNDKLGAGGSSCAPFVTTGAIHTAQAGLATGCAGRAASDVSALADGLGGILVYDSTYVRKASNSWQADGGTSAAAPLVAAMYAESRNHTSPAQPYTNVTATPSLWQDVTNGTNVSTTPGSDNCGGTVLCNAGTGWDGPSGVGMPLSPEAFALPLAPFAPTTVAVSGNRNSRLSASVAVPITARDTAGNAQQLAKVQVDPTQQSGLPAGTALTLSGGKLLLSGTPTATGSGTAYVAATGTTPAGRTTTGQIAIPWTIHGLRFVNSSKVRIAGRVQHGRTVRVVLPKLHTSTAKGATVRPSWSVTWLLNGKAHGHGRRLHLPKNAAHDHLRVRVTAKKTGYQARQFASATVRVR